MSFLDFLKRIFGGGKPKPPDKPPQPVLYTVRFEVFEGDPFRDSKVVNAWIKLLPEGRVAFTDAAGNAEFYSVAGGAHTAEVKAEGYLDAVVSLTVPSSAQQVSLELAAAPLPIIHCTNPVFRDDRASAAPWRYRGATAFRLPAVLQQGEDPAPFFADVKGANILRIFPYVEWPSNLRPWDCSPREVVRAVEVANKAGFSVEVTLLTSGDPGRVPDALDTIRLLSARDDLSVLIEAANEPQVNGIDTRQLEGALEASGLPFSSGDYQPSSGHFGLYLTAHTPRDFEWPRKAKDLLEYRRGGGPEAETDPAHPMPCVADEPIRPDLALDLWRNELAAQRAAGQWAGDDFALQKDAEGRTIRDFYAYSAVAALAGAGFTFHSSSGKWCDRLTAFEARCAEAAFMGASVFPPNAPIGNYDRIDESGNTLRSYIVGEYLIRVRPTTPKPPGDWVAMDTVWMAWRKA